MSSLPKSGTKHVTFAPAHQSPSVSANGETPTADILARRLRTLNKRMNKIDRYAEEQEAGKALEKDQVHAVQSGPQIRGAIEELNEIHKQFLDLDREEAKRRKQDIWLRNKERMEEREALIKSTHSSSLLSLLPLLHLVRHASQSTEREDEEEVKERQALKWANEAMFRFLDQWEKIQGGVPQEGWEETVTRQLDQWSSFLTEPTVPQTLDLGTGPEGFEEIISLPTDLPLPSSILSKRLSRWAPAPMEEEKEVGEENDAEKEDEVKGEDEVEGEDEVKEEINEQVEGDDEEDVSLSGSSASSTLYSSISSLSSSGVYEPTAPYNTAPIESTIRTLEEGEPDEFIPPHTIPLPKGGLQFMSMSEILSPVDNPLPPPIQLRPHPRITEKDIDESGKVHEYPRTEDQTNKRPEPTIVEEVVVDKKVITETKEKSVITEGKRKENELKGDSETESVLKSKRTEDMAKKGEKPSSREKGQKGGEGRPKGRGRSGGYGRHHHHRKAQSDTLGQTGGHSGRGGSGAQSPTSQGHSQNHHPSTHRRPHSGHHHNQGHQPFPHPGPQSPSTPMMWGGNGGNVHRGRGGGRDGKNRGHGRGATAVGTLRADGLSQ
ncbi:hypothetical protein BJ684DRAFT_15564 [Piptocephalis cylindrospora]|uniref:Uncharacterized protein n=1 Tax=Piptocephalis cylindrospora TaxID=1907219 RepID=A0A4P9Y519_9FUNG|nr:hypothetical protein BJ684DRAFT_15564 [Piptocephalis cylindrospora]|eukprot:RKP14098.1 hypothetical protein BJ684DRAFT_15564 [Piptocephalis cylindrospora]